MINRVVIYRGLITVITDKTYGMGLGHEDMKADNIKKIYEVVI